MLIWNYNEDLSIGVWECVIEYNRKEQFNGILKKGNGISHYFNYYTCIGMDGFIINEEKINFLLLKLYNPVRKSTPLL